MTKAAVNKEEKAKTRAEAMRARLLVAAAEVFAERGYVDTRVSDISKAAGTSHGNFYWHFQNKDEIFLECLRPTIDEVLASSSEASTPSLLITADSYADSFVRQLLVYKKHRALLRVTREAAAQGDNDVFLPMWLSMRRRFIERTTTWLQAMDRAGRLMSDVDPAEAAEAELMLMEQITYVRIGLADPVPDDDTIRHIGDQAARLWFRGVVRSDRT